MSVDLNEIARKISSIRKSKLPEIEENLKKLEIMEQSVAEMQRKMLATDGKVRLELEKIRFDNAIQEIRNAKEKNRQAKIRLSRESLNIGIAGQARQGKSQFLQMLTGLNDSQIPTGDGGYCTASRSVIRNKAPQMAKVIYMSEDDFMRKKVYYAYVGSSESGIQLSPRPRNLRDFIETPLPEPSHELIAIDQTRYELLKQLHEELGKSTKLQQLIGKEENVDIKDLRQYLTKDHGDNYHFIVDHVEIQTPFATLPEDTIVYDVPGMNDPQPGIRETMVRSVTEDADIVFYLRMPNNTGDGWSETDHDIIGILQKVYWEEGVKVGEWVQCVLNLDTRPSSNNRSQVDEMLKKAVQGFEPVICNCGSRDDVCSKVTEIMEKLVSKCGRIDDIRITEASKAFDIVKNILKRDVYDALNNAIGGLVAADSDFNLKEHFKDFEAELRGPFKQNSKLDLEAKIDGILEKYFAKAKQNIREYYDALENGQPVPEHFQVSNVLKLVRDFKGQVGPSAVLETAARNHREAIMAELKEQLANCCDDIVDCYYDEIMDKGFKDNQVLQHLFTDTDGEQRSSRDKIRVATARLRASENCNIPNICGAFESIMNFHLSYEGNILPSYYETPAFDDLDPDNKSDEFKGFSSYLDTLSPDFNKQANDTFAWLKEKTEEILSYVVSPNTENTCRKIIAKNLSYVILANYKSFSYHLIWGDTVENEWWRFAEANQFTFWGPELQDAEQKSAVAGAWRNLLKQLANALN